MQQQARIRQDQQHQMLQRMPMGPNGVGMGDYGAMMRFPNGMHNDSLQRRALQNRGGLQPYVSPGIVDPAILDYVPALREPRCLMSANAFCAIGLHSSWLRCEVSSS